MKEWTPRGASLAALGWATANRDVLGGLIRCPARDYLLYCLNVIVRNCGKLYYVRGVWNRDDQQVPDYKAGQRVLRVDTCDASVEDSNVRDLLGKAVGAEYQGSTTLKEQRYKRRQQRQGLAGEGCRSSILREYHAGGAAVGETTATSGTCWFVV